ncbi:MotE family protein [Thermohalobaculum xanthum]|nr:hypothetical protein [Thermohalobaculum xanthum]
MSGQIPVARGALSVLAAGFMLSAMLRAGDVVAGLPALRDDGFGNAVASRGEGADEPRPEVDALALIAEVQRQAARLRERDAELDARARELEDAEVTLKTRLEQLEAMRRELEAEVAGVQDAAAADVRRLATVYETMKPKQAGRIFDEMEPSFAAGFLGELSAEQAAEILASMKPQRAYAISILLAGRNLRGTSVDGGAE